MEDIWNIDVENANLLITESADCLNLYSTQSHAGARGTHLTIVRAKITSLKKTVGDLEITLRDLVESNSPGIDEKRATLNSIKEKLKSLELFLHDPSQGPNTPLLSPNASPTSQRDRLQQMSSNDLLLYRDSTLRKQDEELAILNKGADAVHNISTHIRDEVNLHTRLLGEVDIEMDHTRSIIDRNRERFTQMVNRGKKGSLLLVIFVLAVILFVLIFVF